MVNNTNIHLISAVFDPPFPLYPVVTEIRLTESQSPWPNQAGVDFDRLCMPAAFPQDQGDHYESYHLQASCRDNLRRSSDDNNDGVLLNSILNKGAITSEPRPDGMIDNRFRAVQQLEVPPGAAYIRLVVRNPENDRTGALEVRLPLKQETQTAQAGAEKNTGENN